MLINFDSRGCVGILGKTFYRLYAVKLDTCAHFVEHSLTKIYVREG